MRRSPGGQQWLVPAPSWPRLALASPTEERRAGVAVPGLSRGRAVAQPCSGDSSMVSEA